MEKLSKEKEIDVDVEEGNQKRRKDV